MSGYPQYAKARTSYGINALVNPRPHPHLIPKLHPNPYQGANFVGYQRARHVRRRGEGQRQHPNPNPNPTPNPNPKQVEASDGTVGIGVTTAGEAGCHVV
jgi:hypothetical protein